MSLNPKNNTTITVIPLPYRHEASMGIFKDKTDLEI